MIAPRFARNAIIGLIALAAIGIAKPAAAEDPSPASILIAKQLVEIKGVKNMYEPVMRGIVQKAKDMFMQTNFMWAKDLNESAAAVDKDYESRINEMIDATARIYASHFTEVELRGMLAFYQSPVGQKMAAEEPKAISESMRNTSKWAEDLSGDVVNKLRAEMKKRGHDL